ncbi:ABC transporter permease [Planotetraspora sp. A-T 1434]|uniref:ABC transporter permease n=1 Tax=Planotetraspora sp. A-T 1434 TaxID=2979219 RepID=UPI0021C210EB|nr:ABC transporter permease [Planotetraspora sp. A-T 1434]MCT9930109.1 ABC transporter permease [Planotetraspora sp. A-T 1434]
MSRDVNQVMSRVVSRLMDRSGTAVLTIAGALALTTLVMVIVRVDPAEAYPALIRGAVADGNLEYTIASFVPTLGMALAFAIPLRTGEFNLGGDGQMALGGVVAAALALRVPLPSGIAVIVPLAAATLTGALVAGVSAPLRTRLGIPAIVTTLLISSPAVALASYLVRFPLAEAGTGNAQTPLIPDDAHLPSVGESGYVTLGLPLILLLTAAWLYVDGRTVLGYEIRATGANREFARYGGVPVDRLEISTLAGGGAFAGLVGGLIVLGPPFRFVDGALTAPGYTFTAIAAVLLATGRPVVVPFTVALMTILQVGGQGMERDAGVPSQLTQIMQGLIIVIVAVLATVRHRAGKRAVAAAIRADAPEPGEAEARSTEPARAGQAAGVTEAES